MTLISVLMPVRNAMPYLADAVHSVLNQSHGDLELIVIDDGSTDGSYEAARACDDRRVRVIRTAGMGVARATNLGLASARGQLIARQDADDLSHRDRLAAQLAYFNEHPSTIVVSSRVRFVDTHGRTISTAWTDAVETQWEAATTPTEIRALMPQTCCFVHGSVMMRREPLLAVGGYSPSVPVSQDYDLWLRLLPRGDFARLPDRLYTFRLHDAQISSKRRHEQRAQAIAAKLRFLRANFNLPAAPFARIEGAGAGVDLYREALIAHGWRVEEDRDPDVTIFTQFDTLERDMQTAMGAMPVPGSRIGNFLLSGPASWLA